MVSRSSVLINFHVACFGLLLFSGYLFIINKVKNLNSIDKYIICRMYNEIR